MTPRSTTLLPGLDVIIDGQGPNQLLDRAVFSALMQDVRPVTIHVVGSNSRATARFALLLKLAADADLVWCNAPPQPRRRYQAILGHGDVIYPEGWRLLIAALETGTAATASGAILIADVRPGPAPYVTAKRTKPSTADEAPAHGTIRDYTRPASDPSCRIEAIVGETWTLSPG